MLTVDVEALPKRAIGDHVSRLIWGVHEHGTAGVREISDIADEFNAPHIFFVDICGAYALRDQVGEVIRWLSEAGQDVQLHTHPEYLPEAFWDTHGYACRPRFMNQFDQDKAAFTIRYFSQFMESITHEPVRAFRAGSFRWNANTIRALEASGIPLSFNNSTSAFQRGQAVYSEKTNHPFYWSNGVVEVPVTEKRFSLPFVNPWWGRLQFPAFHGQRNSPWKVLFPYTRFGNLPIAVLLLHSWSLLYWDEQGYAYYRDDKRIEDYRGLVRRMSKDYDIITTKEFVELQALGKIGFDRRVDLTLAEWSNSKKSTRYSGPSSEVLPSKRMAKD